jgi:hypothetical protein
MNPAVLALSILFVADDAALPSLLLQMVERPGAREVTLVMVDDDQAPLTMQLADAGGRSAMVRADWPLPPLGVGLNSAVDGVIVTIDDAGVWRPMFAVAAPPVVLDAKGRPVKAPKTKPLASTLPWPAPSLPVAGPTALRLFVPSVVDGVVGPASLHGADGVRIPGVAVAWRRSFADLGAVALSSVGQDVDGSPPTVLVDATATPATGNQACAPVASSVLQRWTRSTAGAPVCAGSLVVARLAGTRFGDAPARDLPAHGLLVGLKPPPAPVAAPAAPPPPTVGPKGPGAAPVVPGRLR